MKTIVNRNRPRTSIVTIGALAALLVLPAVPFEAWGQGGGRVYKPKRLRTRAEAAARGRTMTEQRRAPSNPRQPAQPRAIIPNPEPRKRGGGGYVKRGKSYFEKPGQIRMRGNRKRRVERVTIPHPNPKMR